MKQSIPSVSAVIPVYNGAKSVGRAIESALAQTIPLLEIIVVDDESSDNSALIAEAYPVKVIRKPNGGPASARNAGILAAGGEWIAFLDHDDTWQPNKTELQLAYIHPGISAVFSEKFPETEPATFTDMWRRNLGGNPSSTIIRADVLRALGMFDTDPAIKGTEDYNLWLRFLLAGYKFRTTPCCYFYTPEENHLSGDPKAMLAAQLNNLSKIASLASLSKQEVDARIRAVRLEYIPDLIATRHLIEARRHLRHLRFDRSTAKYWISSYTPIWTLNALRKLRAPKSRRRRGAG